MTRERPVSPLLCDSAPVTLIGGVCPPPEALEWALARAPRLVAADGGAAHAIALGRMPEMVIGDMDSLDAETRDTIAPERLHHVAEQDSTDFGKCLMRIAAPLVVGVGFLGARLDHSLAALSLLIHAPRACMLVGAEDVAFALRAPLDLDLPVGTRVSLFPLEPVAGCSEGLRWPIDGIAFSPSGPIGTSNESVGPVRLEMDGPGMIVFLPVSQRDAALSALRRGDDPVAPPPYDPRNP